MPGHGSDRSDGRLVVTPSERSRATSSTSGHASGSPCRVPTPSPSSTRPMSAAWWSSRANASSAFFAIPGGKVASKRAGRQRAPGIRPHGFADGEARTETTGSPSGRRRDVDPPREPSRAAHLRGRPRWDRAVPSRRARSRGARARRPICPARRARLAPASSNSGRDSRGSVDYLPREHRRPLDRCRSDLDHDVTRPEPAGLSLGRPRPSRACDRPRPAASPRGVTSVCPPTRWAPTSASVTPDRAEQPVELAVRRPRRNEHDCKEPSGARTADGDVVCVDDNGQPPCVLARQRDRVRGGDQDALRNVDRACVLTDPRARDGAREEASEVRRAAGSGARAGSSRQRAAVLGRSRRPPTGDYAADGGARPRKSPTTAANCSGCSTKTKCPQSAEQHELGVADALGELVRADRPA